jgi:vitamin B12 transporter
MVVTATRGEESIARTGSAISVVTEGDLAASNPLSPVDALRGVPGLDVSETGGPGATTSVRLRGANPGQTLVLIDGVRVNDPAAASGDYDFSMVPVGAIARIEVLRGPQSALYGSDAIGGVVNIITKKGGGPAQFNLRTEAGSYGTLSSSGSLAGAHGPWSYAFSGTGQRADGFSRYGYRIPSIEARFPNLEPDGFDRWAGAARVGYDAGQGVRFDAGVLGTRTRAAYDQASGAFPDTPSGAIRRFEQAWGRAAVDTGALTHSLHVYANRTDRSFTDVTYRINMLPANTSAITTDFIGDRFGGEYQGNLRMGAFGSLTFGARSEHETANTFAEQFQPTPRPRMPMLAGEQTTHAGFALWQLPIADRLFLTLGARIDDVANVDRFETWRATAAYLVPESGTKLRASAGTGGKAPTLFQLFAPTFGNPSLQSEESFGWDAGIDQSVLNGRANVSVTWFENKLSNLIEFDSLAMRYFNVARATTSGLEVGADADLLPGRARLKAAYTWLRAHDAVTGLRLQRRPEHAARVALALTPLAQWLIEPRLYAFSERFSSANQVGRLAPYARFDIYTDHALNPTWRVFARVENITNTRYQEVLNFGTTGRALYGGFNATW